MKYSCEPISRTQLRAYAQNLRLAFKLENCLYFPVIQFLEILPIALKDEDLHSCIVSDNEWAQPESVHAYFDLGDNCIYIKESVYNGAAEGVGRDRMTIIHECAHVLLLKHSHLKLQRNFGPSTRTCQDPEWQAKCLAGELMIPKALVAGMTAQEVSEVCGVSLRAASYQLSKY